MAKIKLQPEDEAAFKRWLASTCNQSDTARAMGESQVEILRRGWWAGVCDGFSRGLQVADREGDIMRLQHKRTEI